MGDPIPYSFKYGVSDAHSGAELGHEESEDGGGSRVGTYSVHLPDGRVQHVNYHANYAEGYVAEVVYEGTAHFPEVVAHHGHHVSWTSCSCWIDSTHFIVAHYMQLDTNQIVYLWNID